MDQPKFERDVVIGAGSVVTRSKPARVSGQRGDPKAEAVVEQASVLASASGAK
jgi:hypothetical protein